MASVTITITDKAHTRLKKLKTGKDSFSDVILREVPDPDATLPEIVEALLQDSRSRKRRRHAKDAA